MPLNKDAKVVLALIVGAVMLRFINGRHERRMYRTMEQELLRRSS